MIDMPVGLCRWLEIDLDKLAANLQKAQQHVGCGVIAVVKNDAYGFGAVEAARTFAEAGAVMLAVTTTDEALELREAGIKAPVLVFTPPQSVQEAACLAKHGLVATLDGTDTAELLAAAGEPECHIKLNTGMNRFGVEPAALPGLLADLAARPNIKLSGMYSHLATALESDDTFARRQIAEFSRAKDEVIARGYSDICFHLANSAGALKFPEARFNAVRLGSLLYAQLGAARQHGLDLSEPFCAVGRIAAVRNLQKGDTVGYGREFTAPGPMRAAVVPFGYGDGFGVQPAARPLTVKGSVQALSRNLGKLALGRAGRYVYYQGRPLPVLGRVAMQNMLVDIGDLPLKKGDVVNVPLRRTAASAKIPRVYLKGGRFFALRCVSRILQDELEKSVK